VKDDRVYLLHVLEAIRRIFAFTAEGEEAFLSDIKTQDAVVRNLEIIGEAVKNISGGLRQAHPAIPWKRIAGMRDKLIHEYFGVNLKLVFEVVRHDLPELHQSLQAILKEMNADD
jgi:uncharacterized protein with HEPN domain